MKCSNTYSVAEYQPVLDLWRPQTKTDVIPFQVFPSFTVLLVCELKPSFFSLHLECFPTFFKLSYSGIMKLCLHFVLVF